jgi:hypothetical protein
VLSAAGETENTQETIKIGLSWMKETLDFSFSQRKKLLQRYYLAIFISTIYIIKFFIYLFSNFFLLGLSFASFIRMASPPLIRISKGLL